jgi:hypothetical protein
MSEGSDRTLALAAETPLGKLSLGSGRLRAALARRGHSLKSRRILNLNPRVRNSYRPCENLVV